MADEKKKLGEILLEAGVIDKFQLKSALAEQNKWGGRLGNHLVQMGILTEDLLVKALSKQLKIPNLDLPQMAVTPDVLELVPQEIAEKFHLVPVAVKKIANKKTLIVAMSDPTNLDAIDELQFRTGHIIKPAVAGDTAIELAIRRYYYGETGPQRVAGQPIEFDPAAATEGPAVTNVPSAGVPVPPEAEFAFAADAAGAPAPPRPAARDSFLSPTPAVAPMPAPAEPDPNDIPEASLADLGMEVQPEAEPTQPDSPADGGAAYAAAGAQSAWAEPEAAPLEPEPLEAAPEATAADGVWPEPAAADGTPVYTDPASAWGDSGAPSAEPTAPAWSEPAADPMAGPEEPTLALEENPPVADTDIMDSPPAAAEPAAVDTWAEAAAPAYDAAEQEGGAPADGAMAPADDGSDPAAAAPEYQDDPIAASDDGADPAVAVAPEYLYDPTAATIDVPPAPDAGYDAADGASAVSAEAGPEAPYVDSGAVEALAPPEIPPATETSSDEVWPEPGPSVTDEPPPSMDATLEVSGGGAVLDPPAWAAEPSVSLEPSGNTPIVPAEPGPAEAAVNAMESVPSHWSAGDAVQTLLGGNEGHFEPTAPGEPTHAGEEPQQLAADGGVAMPVGESAHEATQDAAYEAGYENGAEPTHVSEGDPATDANGVDHAAGGTQPDYVLPVDPLGGIPFDTAEGRAIRAICALLMEKGLLTAEELAWRLQTAVQGTGEGS